MLGVLGDQAAEEGDCSDLLENSQFISTNLQIVIVGPGCGEATNQPNVFGDTLPKGSSGAEDIPLQLRAIRATIEHIEESTFISGGFAYCWDSRGKGWQEKFVDGDQWSTGHWIDGKIVKEDV